MHLVGGGQGLFGGETVRIGGHRLLECRLSCGLLSLFGGGLLGRLCRGFLILNRAAECLGSEPVLRQGLAGAIVTELGDPTLQAGITARIHGDIGTEFRILVGDFCQQNRIRVRILNGSDRSIIINHGITSLCSLGYAERMVRSVCSVASSMAPISSPSSSLNALNA